MSQPTSTAPYERDLELAVIDGDDEHLAGPVICLLGAICAVGFFGFVLFYLSQPTVYPNPGLAAYIPPPATQLVPDPRTSDAPEIATATLRDEPPSAMTALAQAPQKPTKEPDPPSQEHGRPPPHQGTRAFGYAQPWDKSGHAPQWDSPYRDSNVNRGGAARPRISGGPKSSF